MSELIDITMPADSQEGTETVLASWFKKPGEIVKAHEPILEVNTDKVTMEVPAPASGVLIEVLKQENDQIEPGELLGRIELREANLESEAKPAQASSETSTTANTGDTQNLSPAVRRLLKQHNLSASQITGSGSGGRITHQDVEDFLKSDSLKSDSGSVGAIPSENVPHTQMRRNIATHMVSSMLNTAPHVTSIFDLDLSAVIEHRSKHKPEFEAKGVKLTFTAYFIQAAVAALKAVPEVNSRWHDDYAEVYKDINIGVAAALESGGLIVPVINKAQDLDLFQTAQTLNDLTTRARSNSLEPKEVQNGTFTITNHGVSGSLIATPIINQPQSAILGLGKLEKRVVVVEKDGEEETVIKPMLYVTLTIDHRMLDGFQANKFLGEFVGCLEGWGSD